MRTLLGNANAGPGKVNDVCGLAIGADGVVVLHRDSVEGVASGGRSLWIVPLPSPPVRWGLALAGKRFTLTLSDGQVLCFGESPEQN